MAESAHRRNNKECCMCGDLGLPNALFRCGVCLFRSQHRHSRLIPLPVSCLQLCSFLGYCSDLYPKAETYRICNWCLRDRETQPSTSVGEDNSSASSGVSKNSDGGKIGLKRKFIGFDRRLSLHMQSVKKNRSMEFQPRKYTEERTTEVRRDDEIVAGRKGGSFGRKDELLRTKSDDFSSTAKVGMARQIGRGKVRRYKLLEEVSS
ncbi:hypothetical protein EJ110_NYTH50848 [Nymphaea thermarum]|nr:hypothetical protein EJ110_NYTH50848 [Nymphaea thermarum]